MIKRAIAGSLTAERLRELVAYNPESGDFTWLVRRNNHVKAGDVAGNLHSSGRRQIMIDGRNYKAHRLAVLYVHGRFPSAETDHINGQPDDNRWANLREASKSENQQNQRNAQSNNKSGFLGVSWHAQTKKWRAQIGLNKKRIYLGLFSTAEEAHQAYLTAKRELHSYCTI
tara:strand:+ start:724 stop:1236 length:513 start_codon:yes stop_codon:yes gene_type:complete